jgi:hypothetical protein
MASLEDVLEVFDFLRCAGVKKVPRKSEVGNAHAYAAVLQHVHPEHVVRAASQWCQNPDGGQWMPAAPELLSLCLLLESQDRHQQREITRGCRGCGELLDDEGGIETHGTGYRTITQHCYPRGDDGAVVWTADPHRIGQRLVLCSCTKGEHTHQGQSRVSMESMPKGWQPTLTIERALHVFRRDDARLWITGTDHRACARDADPRSPFFSCPSPEETLADPYEAVRQRRVMDNAMKGIVPAGAATYLRMAGLAMGRPPEAAR